MKSCFPKVSVSPTAAPTKLKILIVEDDPKDLGQIKAELANDDMSEPDTVTRFRELADLLGKKKYDVASIDWELHGVEKGGDILRLLVKRDPEVVRVVFTQHEKREDEAFLSGADAFVLKQSNNDFTEYVGVLKKAGRLGLARQIENRLMALAVSGLPSFATRGIDLDEQAEKALFQIAVQTELDCQAAGKDDAGLVELLVRRGWWPLIENEETPSI